MNSSDIILGAGIAGTLVALRLRRLGVPYIILEARNKPLIEAASGFYYLHEPIFGNEQEIAIQVESCPGGSPAKYAKKVYGDENVGPVSFVEKPIRHLGYRLSAKVLLEGMEDGKNLQLNTRVNHVRIVNGLKFISTEDGRFFPFRRLHSTIPLPFFLGINEIKTSLRFNSNPIWVNRNPISMARDIAADAERSGAEIYCRYCAGDCHPWYRATVQDGRIDEEHNLPYSGTFAIRPGKIWLTPGAEFADRKELDGIRKYHEEVGIYLWGRFGTWTPKMLSHHVWRETERLSTSPR